MIQKNEKQEKLLHVESLYSVKKVRLLTQHTMLHYYKFRRSDIYLITLNFKKKPFLLVNESLVNIPSK